MASTDVQMREDGLLAPPGTARSPTQQNLLLIWGGISGIISALAYGSTQGIPALADVLHSFPIEKTFLVRLAGFWIQALWPVFALFMVYVLYRLLEEGPARHVAFLGFLSGVVAFPIVVIHNLVQSTVHVEVSDLAASDPTFSPEVWDSVVAAVHGVDNGIDLAWDVFFVLWLVLTGVAMLRHRRFGLWWGIPAIVLGALLLVLNAATVPDPPASAGLFDAGPLSGLYALALSVYLVRLGLGDRSKRATTRGEGPAPNRPRYQEGEAGGLSQEH